MDIKTKTANLIKRNYNLPKQTTFSMFDEGLLTEHQCKKVLIRDAFLSSSTKLRVMELKQTLAEQFCVSLSTVDKYIQGI